MKYKNNTRYKYQTMLSKQQPKRKRASVTPNSLVRRPTTGVYLYLCNECLYTLHSSQQRALFIISQLVCTCICATSVFTHSTAASTERFSSSHNWCVPVSVQRVSLHTPQQPAQSAFHRPTTGVWLPAGCGVSQQLRFSAVQLIISINCHLRADV